MLRGLREKRAERRSLNSALDRIQLTCEHNEVIYDHFYQAMGVWELSNREGWTYFD